MAVTVTDGVMTRHLPREKFLRTLLPSGRRLAMDWTLLLLTLCTAIFLWMKFSERTNKLVQKAGLRPDVPARRGSATRHKDQTDALNLFMGIALCMFPL